MEMDQSSSILEALLKQIETRNDDVQKRMELLENLRTAMANFPKSDLIDSLRSVSLEILFESLASDDEDEISAICGILSGIMLVLDPAECLEKYHDSVLQGFQHNSETVRTLILAQLQRCAESSKEIVDLLCSEYQDLIIASINQITSEDVRVYRAASVFLVKLAETTSGSDFLLGAAGMQSFKTILRSPRTTGTIKFRVYETLCNMANYSSEHLQRIEEHQLLTNPLTEIAFSTDDPLGQMNALEILSILAESTHGVNLLDKTGVLGRLGRQSISWKQDAMMATLFYPSVLKFIGKVGLLQVPPDELIDLVIEALLEDGNDFALATVALESLAFIGSGDNGKSRIVLHRKPKFTLCFNRIQWLLKESPVDFRCRVLDALGILFAASENYEGLDFLPKWFQLTFPKMATLFSIVQHAFPEVRLSGLNFLAGIANLEWAQAFYLRIPGVVEFLLQRNIEPNKECRMAKFNIVTILAKSPTARKFLDGEDIRRLKIHVDQGLNYVEAQTIVAMEGA